jgi:hypothetical protein
MPLRKDKDGNWFYVAMDEAAEEEYNTAVLTIRSEVNDTVRRVVRTFIQAFTGTLSVSLPTLAATTDLSVLLSSLSAIGVSAAVAGATAVVTLAHNTLENYGKLPNTK